MAKAHDIRDACEPVIEWLFSDGRLIKDPCHFVEDLGRILIDSNFPLWRIRIGCRTIHPLVAAWSVIWSPDMSAPELRTGRHNFEKTSAYRNSPLAYIETTGQTYRRRLDLGDLTLETDHQLLFELAEQGATDYVALRLGFSDGTNSNITFVTAQEGGLSARDLEAIEYLSPFIAPVFEVIALRRMARTLLDTYVGPRTGERVLAGQIKRGDGEVIHAAIWFSDLRDFTPLTETLESNALIDLLNTYFETIAAAVTERGGEILRFIGDAMLIVFPVTEDVSLQQACEAGLDAAEDAFSKLYEINTARRANDQPEIRFGVGLHVGEVVYGNVGAPDRMDFTVMGPAVNRTARLEGLTKAIGSPLLMTTTFKEAISYDTESCGLHSMKGVSEAQEVFRLKPSPATAP